MKLRKTFFLFSFLITALSAHSSSSIQQHEFNTRECLDANYQVEVKHPSGLFGLLKNKLTLKKTGCQLEVSYVRIPYLMEKSVTIDVCRLPVHIKKGTRSVEVLKKKSSCMLSDNIGDAFCQEYRDLVQIISDNGLIFAEGDKEVLDSPHGQVFCAYTLINHYLGDSVVFSRFHDETIQEPMKEIKEEKEEEQQQEEQTEEKSSEEMPGESSNSEEESDSSESF